MRTKQSGLIRSEFYTSSPVWSVWSGPKIIHYSLQYKPDDAVCFRQGDSPKLDVQVDCGSDFTA